MSLFDRSSVLLIPGETVVKLGRCDGKVPGGEALGVNLSLPTGKGKIKWEKIKGEMVLTTNRLLIVGERGRLRRKVMTFLNLDLRCIEAVSTSKRLIGKQKLSLSTDILTGKLETMEFNLEDASSWVAAIRGQIWQTPQQVMAIFLKNKESYERGDLEGKTFVNMLKYFNFRDDDDGKYWTIGVRSEKWYYHDGVNWVKGTPPSSLSKVVSQTMPDFPMAPTKEKCTQCNSENVMTAKFCVTCGQRLT